VLTETPVHLFLAQMMVEHGLVDSIAPGLGNARYRFEACIGEGNSVYIFGAPGAAVALACDFERRETL
jgi:hypothetical protein